MVQTEIQSASRGNTGAWIFRVLVVAGAAFMVYTWFAPWWSASVAVLPGDGHLVLHPWGVEVHPQIRATADESLYSMPGFFAPFMWAYLTVCMLALAASLFVERRISLGRLKLSLPMLLIALVGFSYMAALGIAYAVGEVRAEMAGSNFIGTSQVKNSISGARIKMVSDLEIGYWLALSSGAVLFVLALLRGLFVRSPKA